MMMKDEENVEEETHKRCSFPPKLLGHCLWPKPLRAKLKTSRNIYVFEILNFVKNRIYFGIIHYGDLATFPCLKYKLKVFREQDRFLYSDKREWDRPTRLRPKDRVLNFFKVQLFRKFWDLEILF
jgi:hypothetical protein